MEEDTGEEDVGTESDAGMRRLGDAGTAVEGADAGAEDARIGTESEEARIKTCEAFAGAVASCSVSVSPRLRVSVSFPLPVPLPAAATSSSAQALMISRKTTATAPMKATQSAARCVGGRSTTA